MAHFRESDARGWRRGWGKIAIYVWVLLLPLLLAGVGLWERSRNIQSLQLYGQAAQALPGTLDALRRIEARNPTEMIEQVSGDARRSVPVSMAVADVEQTIPIAERGAMLSRIRAPLAVAAIAGGLLAFVAGAAGMLIAARAGTAARKSRNQLIASFSRVHRMLPILLGALVVGLASAIVGVTGFEAIGMWFWRRVSGGELKLAGIGVILAGMAAYGAFAAIRGLRDIFTLNTPEPMEEAGHIVDDADAPGLWRFVRELATRQNALVPEAIVIGIDGGFYVTEHAMKLTPGGETLTGRTLYIPAPYLEMMDEEELAGVIGHELAHFVGEDTAYSRHFSPIYLGLERALDVMGDATAKGFAMYPAYRLGQHMIEQFDYAVKHWGRLREFEADRLSSLASGPRSIAQSLVRTSVIAPVVTTTLEKAFTEPAGEERDLIADMVGLVREHGWPDVAQHLGDHAAHPTDTHPSTPQRIEALKLNLHDGLTAAATRPPTADGPSPGERLFADWLATRRTLSADFQAVARNAHAAHRASLESAAAAVGDEEVPLYENSGPLIWTLGIIGGLVGLGALWMLSGAGNDQFVLTAGGLGAAMAAVMIGYAVMLARSRRAPIFVLGPATFFAAGLSRPIPWLDIEGFGVSAGYRLETTFLISPDAELPKAAGFWSRTRVKRKKRTVTFRCYGIRKMPPAALSERIDIYLNAAHARRALQERYSTR
jgi:Zn-dependent protease with chaperone function